MKIKRLTSFILGIVLAFTGNSAAQDFVMADDPADEHVYFVFTPGGLYSAYEHSFDISGNYNSAFESVTSAQLALYVYDDGNESFPPGTENTYVLLDGVSVTGSSPIDITGTSGDNQILGYDVISQLSDDLLTFKLDPATGRGHTYWENDFMYNKAILTVGTESSAVPIPGAVWLLGSGLLGMAGLKKRKKFTINKN